MIGQKKRIGAILFALISIFVAVFNLKTNKKLVQASYLMLSCEKCNHMEVVKSSDESLISKTIIPESNVYDIEDLISKSLIEKGDLCLEGYLYVFNISTIWIDPPGIRFKIENSYPLSQCENLPGEAAQPERF